MSRFSRLRAWNLIPALNADLSQTAAAMLAAYEAVLNEADGHDGDAEAEHPRVFLGLDARNGRLADIKASVDALANVLVNRLLADYPAARRRIEAAHRAAQHYDSTLCEPQDW